VQVALQDGNLRVEAEVELLGNEVVLDMDPRDDKKSSNNWVIENLFKSRSESDFSLIWEGQAVPGTRGGLALLQGPAEAVLGRAGDGLHHDGGADAAGGVKDDPAPRQGNMARFFLAGQRIRQKAKQFVRTSLMWLRGQAGWKEAFGAEKDLLIELL
jgi:hypothetical protein